MACSNKYGHAGGRAVGGSGGFRDDDGNGVGQRSLPIRGRPNSKSSFTVDGRLVQKRYYDALGRAKRDVDYTDHESPKRHPKVPLEHTWDWSNPNKPERGDLQ